MKWIEPKESAPRETRNGVRVPPIYEPELFRSEDILDRLSDWIPVIETFQDAVRERTQDANAPPKGRIFLCNRHLLAPGPDGIRTRPALCSPRVGILDPRQRQPCRHAW